MISELSAIHLSQEKELNLVNNISLEEDDFGPIYRVAKIQPSYVDLDFIDNIEGT
jgi:hypothetical protein